MAHSEMIRLMDLKATMRKRASVVVELCEAADVVLLIYCTYRSPEAQAKLYRKGRTIRQIRRKAAQLREYNKAMGDLLLDVGPQYGFKVTNAGPGQSYHQYGWAFDAVPLLHGKAVWDSDDPLWRAYGQCVRDAGLEWAGDWRNPEYPHAQMPGKDWRKLIGKLKPYD